MSEQVITSAQMQLMPEYQERYVKDLLSNLYRTEQQPTLDEEGNPVLDAEGNPVTQSVPAGIASRSPLLGQPQFDDDGNPIYRRDTSGNLILDARGQPIQDVIGGVPRPDIMPLTPAQQQAIQLGIQGIGAYAPLMEEAKGTYETGVGTLEGSLGRYDPRGQVVRDYQGNAIMDIDPTTGASVERRVGGYKDFYDPFVEQVIDTTEQDIQRQATQERARQAARAVGSGAFGGSRAEIAEQEIQRGADDRKARTGAQLRSAAFSGAQQQAASAFENAQKRGQSGAQLFQGLGTAQAGLGQLAQGLGYKDVSNLMNVGGVEQQQMQAEYDVQRQSAIEQAYEPFTRFGTMANIFATATRGTPASSISLGAKPEQNVLGSTIAGAQGLGAYQQQYGGGSILGGLINR
tara:strand:- start:7805 stop:9016 length:1212 start_codon:yes stop_codon:yes gene_type:complete